MIRSQRLIQIPWKEKLGVARLRSLAHPHFSICTKPKVRVAWSGLLERIHRPPLLNKNHPRSLPDGGKHGEAAE